MPRLMASFIASYLGDTFWKTSNTFFTFSFSATVSNPKLVEEEEEDEEELDEEGSDSEAAAPLRAVELKNVVLK